jgi:hypothetical protein
MNAVDLIFNEIGIKIAANCQESYLLDLNLPSNCDLTRKSFL